MNYPILILTGMLLPVWAGAQETAEARTLQKHIENRERRIAELADDILRSDARIEAGIDSILSELEAVKDSNDSQTEVARTKKKVIDGLIRSIEFYDGKRRGLKTEAMKRDPKISRDTLFSDKGKFDERIEKRIGQILELAGSLEEDKDYQRWLVEYRKSSRWRGGDDEYDRKYVRNPDYLRNRKEGDLANSVKKQLSAELAESIERLDRANRGIDEKLKAKISDQYRALLEDEKAANEKLIDVREAQLEQLASANAPETRPIDRKRANDLENMIEDMADDLRREFNALFANYAELNAEREVLEKLRTAAAAPTESAP